MKKALGLQLWNISSICSIIPQHCQTYDIFNIRNIVHWTVDKSTHISHIGISYAKKYFMSFS